MKTLLEVKGLGKNFPSRQTGLAGPWILKDLSFRIAEGEFVTVIGPSGSGKSTLLNILSQVDLPTEGAVLLGDRVVADASTRRLDPGWQCNIGYVTQDDNLLPWRTVIDNVLFPLQVQGRLNDESRGRARELMAAVGLTGFEKYYPHELSGGMRKRAALIRTLVYDPPVILMDEPFGAVDAQTRIQLQSDLLDLWQRKRKTIVFITHDIGEAIALGDRTLVLSKRPARIESEHVIDIARPRNIHDVFSMDAFPRLYADIRAKVQ
jgi:NitT/TauT family transport system ATP-binding protein